ncbi:MAG: molybdopterin-dependent oxidoreductase [Thermoflexales bacterium]|nr:molybdopterin-dependent oxidoreductase [Thermoflexales bacterium]
MFNLLRRHEQEEQVKIEGRLPPGQALTQKFPVLHYGPVPHFNPATWDFRIFGLVEEEKRWTWEEFKQLPRRKIDMDVHCVTRWSKFDTTWEGVHVRDLVEQGIISIKPEAQYILQHAEYGFTANIPLDVILADTFLLATHFNGQPLEPSHGYPLRGVIGAVPSQQAETDLYLWKGAKWLRGLEFRATDVPGFWEQAGYSMTANIWREERFR